MATRVRFASTAGPMLAGLIDEPSEPVRGWGLFVHGLTLGKDCPAAARICKQLARDGVGMLRYDNLGLADSDGDWGSGSFTQKVADTVEAARFMADRGTPIDVLVGHSLGGSAALAAAADADAPSVVTIGAPIEPGHAEQQYDALVDRVLSEGQAEWLVGGRALTLRRAFVEDMRRADLRESIRSLHRPLLVMHSPTDNTVGIANASEIFRTARHPRSFVALEGSDHLLTKPGQAQRTGRIISAWAHQYLDG